MSDHETDDHPLEEDYPDAETLEEETPGFDDPEDDEDEETELRSFGSRHNGDVERFDVLVAEPGLPVLPRRSISYAGVRGCSSSTRRGFRATSRAAGV